MQAALDLAPAENPRILLVEDEAMTAEVVRRYLSLAGYAVTACPDGPKSLSALAAARHDLVVLDLTLPGMDGMEVFRQIRAIDSVPVIILTGRSGEVDRVAGLDAGADDYVTKPFFPRELLARIRRTLLRTVMAPRSDVLRAGPVEMNLLTRRVLVRDSPVSLTCLEFELLAHLVRRPDQVVSRATLFEQVWGYQFGDPSTVTVHVRRLRTKLERDPQNPELITTAWGCGYRFDPSGG